MYYKTILIIGITLILVSIFILLQSLAFISKSEKATGTVTKFEVSTGGDTGTSYIPVFTITTKKGVIVYQHHSSTSPPSWELGEKSLFLYDPNDLKSVRMFSYFSLFSWSIVLIGLGIPLITYGGGYVYLKKYWV